ncbi:unconventional myosin-IXa-like isoform X2 [Leptotrombidium deliense]|uniref:Unconventional myosin-IXa-like isoform X2 n=1 Tax=Leptotrombidium deliense TaxID=299467 RepID=A0A443SQR6_9ACAR|nr:unconventional myosin-IXa-like isoform X2 [Leptotrombidium deliense]
MAGDRFVLQVYVGAFSRLYEALSIEASKQTTAEEILECIAEKLSLKEATGYELAEVIGNEGGQDCKERRISPTECPVALQMLWPKNPISNNHVIDSSNGPFRGPEYRFCLRRKFTQCMNWSFSWTDSNDSQLLKDYFLRFLYQPRDREYPDLCQLPDLTEQTLLENLKARFDKGHIYTYVGSILIAVNPFKFYPIYNPKYVQLYQNRRLGDLPPHIFAIADAAYQAMLRKRFNQCIVISGESGSGKTESTNLLLHHLTALSQKGSHGSGVEQTILGAGPVLEAFGNAKTKHNNNSSRFGKFIQVNYKENGMVHGAIVQKYLLEKSRIVSQAKNERNYHVFYYLLAGSSNADKETLHLTKPSEYFYLNQSKCYTLEGADEAYEFSRLKQSLEMVGFSADKQRRLFAVLSAVLHIGNVEFVKKSTYHCDETVMVKNESAVSVISKLLMVKEETLLSALTCKRTKAAKGEMIIINYKLVDAIATRDAMAKCLYGALFDWIVMQVNQALLSKQDTRDHKGNYIGVLDIFGFEDFGDQNYFEQFCINFANEHLHHYFNQHVFKYEQEEYKRESINWKSIDFHDNVACLSLVEGRPHGLLCLLDDQCNFPGANNETFLQKVVNQHKNSPLFEVPPCRQSAFVIKHYAGKVKYQIKDFREKNMDLMRPDIVSLLKSSSSSFVRELVGSDPLAIFRWQILKAFFKAYFVFTKLREQSKLKRGTFRHLRMIYKCVKNKLNKTPSLRYKGIEKSIKNLQTLKAIVGKTNQAQPLNRTSRKQTPTVTAQFQQSLNQLMETLNQANPFFVRCIKSNAEKIPNHFNDMLVLVQLRYTGMLETVRIRQSGYSVRLSFDEFIQHYRILLPRGLLSSQSDIKDFLLRMNLNRDNYQMGKTKIFMRESEKLALDDMLHKEILKRIITLQRGVRSWITRQRFLRMRAAAVTIQTNVRRWMAFKRVSQMKFIANYQNWAATTIQNSWRTFKERQEFVRLRQAVVDFQSRCRGFLARKQFKEKLDKKRKVSTVLPTNNQSSTSNIDSQSSHSDEAFLSKGSSQEELEYDRLAVYPRRIFPRIKQNSKDSEDSSGVHEDSETENLLNDPTKRIHVEPPPPPLPPRQRQPQVIVIPANISTVQAEAQSPTDELGDKPRLDRRRNRPLRKLSLKRSKSNKSQSNIPLDDKPEHVKIGKSPSFVDVPKSKLVRESISVPLPPSPHKLASDVFSQYDQQSSQKGAFQKAKKTFRTLIIGGNCKNEKKLKEQHLTQEFENTSDDTNNLLNSSQVNTDESKHVLMSSQVLPISNFSLLKRHSVTNVTSFQKSDICTVCECSMQRGFDSLNSGVMCNNCNMFFHASCLSQMSQVPCVENKTVNTNSLSSSNPSRPPRNKGRNKSNKNFNLPLNSQKSESSNFKPSSNQAQHQSSSCSSWSVTRTAEFTDPKDIMITDATELHYLEVFLNNKTSQMDESKRNSGKKSMVDIVFSIALKEFKSNLISTYSVASHEGNLHITYENLINHFGQVIFNVCQKEKTFKSFPVIMGVNAFRGFLDEFRNLSAKYPLEDKRTKQKAVKRKRQKKKENREETIVKCGHKFSAVVANIPTVCEVCSSLMWLMEKMWVCNGCKLTCHKKCTAKVTVSCKDNTATQLGKKIFGAPLERLITEDSNVPHVLEKLITAIELKGLYTEGIYRKSGTTSKISELKAKLDENVEDTDLDSYSVHVLTAVLKSFFRDMPEPLMTFELYDDFLWSTSISEAQERVQAIYSHIAKLPRSNYDVMERLVFHLARVAQQENANRMNANSLAIVFAPCILRTNKQMQMQDKLSDISKQTICIELIINERLRQVRDTLADIDILDTACHTASSRLSSLRLSKVFLFTFLLE